MTLAYLDHIFIDSPPPHHLFYGKQYFASSTLLRLVTTFHMLKHMTELPHPQQSNFFQQK